MKLVHPEISTILRTEDLTGVQTVVIENPIFFAKKAVWALRSMQWI